MYIEADEEVTTIISRLHVAHRQNVALVVPQHSLLLQSIINLRLLAREAKKQQKNIVIVTQDEEGSAFAQKIGIATIPLSQWQEDSRTRSSNTEITNQDSHQQTDIEEPVVFQADDELVQDESHYTLTEDHIEDETGETVTRSYEEKIHRAKRPIGMDIAPQAPTQVMRQRAVQRPEEVQVEAKRELVKPKSDNAYTAISTQEVEQINNESAQFSNLQKPVEPTLNSNQQLHYRPRPSKRNTATGHKQVGKVSSDKNIDLPNTEAPRKIHTFGWLFAFLSAAFVIGFLILPYNVVDVKLGDNQFKETLSLTARTSFDSVEVERRMIPLRSIQKDITRTIKSPATGKEDVDAGKAYGTLKIYNTFSESPQPLVATTRFESPQGDIFRLVKATTVPGMKKVNDKLEPGVVEVSVEADKAGALGTIDSVRWTIPGFQNNKEKFASFYAENDQPMTDGNSAGKNAIVVTEQDIKNLEEQSTQGLSEYLAAELGALLRETEVLLPQALTYEITRSESAVTPGTAAPEAQYIINASVTAYVFDSQNIDQIITDAILAKRNIDPSSVENKTEYSNIKLDINDEKLSFESEVSVISNSDFDYDKFKDDMKGKNQEEVKDILKNDYPFVSEIALRSYPPFLSSKFSRYAWMTSLNVKESDSQE